MKRSGGDWWGRLRWGSAMRLLRAGDADVPTCEHQLALGLAGSSRRCGPRDQAARQRWRQSLGTRAAAGLAIQYATCFASGEARATKTTASIDWKPAMGSSAGGGGGNRERLFFCFVTSMLSYPLPACVHLHPTINLNVRKGDTH